MYRKALSKGRGFLHWIFLMNSLIKLTLLSLFYHDFADLYYIGDACMEPLFWVVDHFTKVLGPICVAAVIILSSSMITIAYVIGLPFYLQQDLCVLATALFLGHWLLVNVVFYYYKALTTDPGFPPQGAMIAEAATICRRCIAPKPPRTHHCSVCNRCILKMDHHCPWLNKCVGHFNHRYFFMFCLYTWVGVVFVITFGIPIAYEHFYGNYEPEDIQHSILTNRTSKWPETLYHSCVVYAGLLSVAVLFVLGGLLAWHARLISRGETSVEGHINKRETQRLSKEGQVYKNPYNFGPTKNWKIFLCIGFHRPWWHLLLPFSEAPVGDGIQWNLFGNTECEGTKAKQNPKTCFIKVS